MQPAILRTNLTLQVYNVLRDALLEGRLRPLQRLKIRDLAALLEVSETPVREAVVQLMRERALVLQTARSLTVPRLSVPTYLELRRIRLELEGLAAQEAAHRIRSRAIAALERLHASLLAAEASGAWVDAVSLNWRFHATVYEAAAMPELFALIQSLWLRTGPLLTYNGHRIHYDTPYATGVEGYPDLVIHGPLLALQYPHAPPTYPGRHRHLDVIDALKAGEGTAVRAAIQADTVEGGAKLLALLGELDAGRTTVAALLADAPGLEALLRPGG